MAPFWITTKLGPVPLFFQRCQHLSVKVNALDFAFILEATLTVGSSLQLGGLISGLTSSTASSTWHGSGFCSLCRAG